MTLDTSIPGFAQIDDWPVRPVEPLILLEWDCFRDGGPQGGTHFAALEDAAKTKYGICFDRLRGRLCFGGTHTDDENVAFVVPGSGLERDIISFLEELAVTHVRAAEIRERLASLRNR